MELALSNIYLEPFYIDGSTPLPLEGDLVNNYTLCTQISNTNCSSVFIATKDNEKKIIKFIKRRKENIEIAINEIQIMDTVSKLNHPNLMRMEEFFLYKEYVCIVEQYAQYGDLMTEIKNRYNNNERICDDLASSIMKQMLEAVYQLHANKICHRDIKPHNFFVFENKNDNFQIALGDFGFSQFFEDGKKEVFHFGTHDFAAPELIKGQPSDFTVDIWALGISLYLLLSGMHPFPKYSNQPRLFYSAIRNNDFNFGFIYNRSQESIDLIRKMCSYEPSERISVKEALENQWITKYQKSNTQKSTYEFVYTDKIDEV